MNNNFSGRQKTTIIITLGSIVIFSVTSIILLQLGLNKVIGSSKTPEPPQTQEPIKEESLDDRIPESKKESLKEDAQKKLEVSFDMKTKKFKYVIQSPASGGLSVAKQVTDSKMMPDQPPNACLSGLVIAAISAEAMPELQRKYAPKDNWGTFAFMLPIARNAVKQIPLAKMTNYSDVREYCQKNAADIFNTYQK